MLDDAAGYEIQINPLQVRRSLPSSLQHPAPASRIEAVVQYDKQGPLRRVIEQAAHVAFNPFRGMVAIDKNKLRRHIRAIQLREQRGQDSGGISGEKGDVLEISEVFRDFGIDINREYRVAELGEQRKADRKSTRLNSSHLGIS